ncbi:MAG: DUF5107 domain-containing protein, partial [Candidatus Fimadaptatus sp.]
IAIDEETVTPEESKYMGWAKVNSILPYLKQDGYDRKKKPKKWHAAILENEYLKAVFLPQLGGRLWSLYDKKAGRELLHKNPVFQPCNLALRNAWFSGGVEWNCGIIGHTPYTCDRMYCEELKLDDGTPVVRMYQYERVRGLIYRVEAFLPEKSDRLFVRVRIDNARKTPTAVYWWSNMAVDEREDVRVITPGTKSYRFGYGGKLKKIQMPNVADMDGIDVSYTTNIPHAVDFFFDLDADKEPAARCQRRWISAVGGDGHGFVQTSTDVLQGRKLFVWGMGAGGRNWQTFLAQKGCQYLEIQAGLAHTQLEHLPMDGSATISWLEAYGPIEVDAQKAHGDWEGAYREVERALEEACPRDSVDAWHERCKQELDGRQGVLRQMGAGWARLEQEALDEEFDTCGLRFPIKSLRQPERQWLTLIERGVLPEPHPMDEPLGYEIGAHWEERLLRSISRGGGHWYCYYQLGVIRAHAGDMAKAREYFELSLEKTRNPWALNCLAWLDDNAGNAEAAAEKWQEAVTLAPEYHLALASLDSLRKLGRFMSMLDVYNNLPHSVRERGRVKTAYCEALIEVGRYDTAEKTLMSDIELTDVREGEVKLSDLWFSLCAHKEARARGVEYSEELLEEIKKTVTVPEKLDFRMS